MKAAENLISQSKKRFLVVFAPENPKDFSTTGRCSSGGTRSPVRQLVKDFFDELSTAGRLWLRLLKKPWRAREGRSSPELPIVPGGVYGGRGTIESGGKSHFPEQKSFLAVFAPENPKDFSKTGRCSSGGTRTPVRQLVKDFFDELSTAGRQWLCFSGDLV